MPVETRLLRYIEVLGTELHFGRAAKRLHISQPALSKQVSQLERRLGVRLFDRHKGVVSVTEPGRALLAQATRVLAEADRFASLAESASRTAAGALRLGFVGQAANELTPTILERFETSHPAVRVELRQFGMDCLDGGLRDRLSDLALLRLPIDLDGLESMHVLTEPRVVVLPDSHALARRSAVVLDDLRDENWLISSSTDPVDQRFTRAETDDRSPRRTGETIRSIDEFLQAVSARRGVALAPLSASRFYARPGVSFVPVTDAEPSNVVLAWLTSRKSDRLITAFADTAETVASAGVEHGRTRTALSHKRTASPAI